MCAACIAGSSQGLLVVAGYAATRYGARWKQLRARRSSAGQVSVAADDEQSPTVGADGEQQGQALADRS